MSITDYRLIFDTETSGIPYRTRAEGYTYTNLDHFKNARLLSISWIILDNNYNIVSKDTYYIKPDNFEISSDSIKIHGLTKEFLVENGITIHELLLNLNGLFEKYNITLLIAHNVNFDINILKSELYRYAYNITLNKINNCKSYCTMFKSQNVMNVRKWPKLAEAYKYF